MVINIYIICFVFFYFYSYKSVFLVEYGKKISYWPEVGRTLLRHKQEKLPTIICASATLNKDLDSSLLSYL